jgi:predicted metal-dependent hydrolase
VPDLAPLEAAKATIPPAFADSVPAGHPAVLNGVSLMRHGFFWEAHEVLEAVWKAAPKNGPDRLALRALIQIANAALKKRMNRPAAERRLVLDAAAALRELGARVRRPEALGALSEALDAPALIHALETTEVQRVCDYLRDHLHKKACAGGAPAGPRSEHEI